jgi:ABC-type Fe3+-siderophore transport system permease subunit
MRFLLPLITGFVLLTASHFLPSVLSYMAFALGVLYSIVGCMVFWETHVKS